jgi:hypothetical protein
MKTTVLMLLPSFVESTHAASDAHWIIDAVFGNVGGVRRQAAAAAGYCDGRLPPSKFHPALLDRTFDPPPPLPHPARRFAELSRRHLATTAVVLPTGNL